MLSDEERKAIEIEDSISILENTDLEAKDIESENYIETYKSYRYRLAHRTCYNNYLKYVKEVNQKCTK